MNTKLNIPGIGELDKSDWYVVFDMGETVLLSSVHRFMGPKVWITKDEWEGREAKEIEIEKDPPTEMPKFNNFDEALDAFSKKKELQAEAGELQEFIGAPEGSLYPLDELKKLALDELLVVMVLAYGEQAVREKLYAVDGHCPKGKKCSGTCKGDKDADS